MASRIDFLRRAAGALSLALALIGGGESAIAQDTLADPCGIGVLQRIEQDREALPVADVRALLTGTPGTCPGNVEYAEWYNELLFAVLEDSPDLFSQTFAGLTPAEQDPVLLQLTQPIHDGSDPATRLAYFAASNRPADSLIFAALSIAIGYETGACRLALTSPIVLDLDGRLPGDTLLARQLPTGEYENLQLSPGGEDGFPPVDLRTLLPDDNLSWVRRIELVPPGIYAPPLLDAESGDLIGVDVRAAVRLQHDGLRLYPEETEGSLLIYVDANGRLRFMYL